jgi:hypothetical protein
MTPNSAQKRIRDAVDKIDDRIVRVGIDPRNNHTRQQNVFVDRQQAIGHLDYLGQSQHYVTQENHDALPYPE